jgi:outer membrane protein assembly factor BamB
MSSPLTGVSAPIRPLRVWPGVVLVAFQAVAMWVLPWIAPEAEPFSLPVGLFGLFAGLAAGLGVVVWWLLFSRARWFERVGILLLLAVALTVVRLIADPSISGAGMGMLLFVGSVPGWCLALVAGAAVASRWGGPSRFAALAAAVLLACVPWALLRTAGVDSTGSEYHWRWSPTPEQQLLARGNEVAPGVSVVPAATASAEVVPVDVDPAVVAHPDVGVPAPPVEWSGFRGSARDGVVRGVRINTDWKAAPPVELWRRPVGPGWSSFAVQGDLIYTQEQRGDDEMVACYRMSTGEPVWGHRDSVRFWESNGGAGPRATPTIHNGRVYAFGATGILNALDATTGALVWTRQVATDTKRALPIWGFTSSPLVVDGLVIVAAQGTLAAFDARTGAHRWTGPSHGGSYSSPHRVVLDGVPQVVLLGGPGAISVAPADGAVLWTHAWEAGPIVQPAVTADGDLLINAIASTGGIGTRRLAVTRKAGTWTLDERWTSNGLKPYFNDLVVHKGHAYGFDGSILAAIDLTDGTRAWKGGRYGNGQLVLLADQDLLIVISEEGELALVSATPDGYSEIARVPALDGKTWNHPVLIGSTLLLRNGQEMVAFRLPHGL